MHNVERLVTTTRSIDISALDEDHRWDDVHDFIQKEVERLNEQAYKITSLVFALDEINLDDPRLRRRIENEPPALTVTRVHEIWLEVTQPDREREARERELHRKTYEKSNTLRYFTITNARGNLIHILADDDANIARHMAWTYGRIKQKNNGNLVAHTSLTIEKLNYAKAIEEAIAAGYPGHIEVMGDKIIHPARKVVFG